MSTWASIYFCLHLSNRHTEEDAQRLIHQIEEWTEFDGYVDEIDHDPPDLISCTFNGEVGFSAEDKTVKYLKALAEQEQIDIRLEWRFEDCEETCAHFGPHAGAHRIQEALDDLDHPIKVIEADRAAITPPLCTILILKAQHLLDLAAVPEE